MFKHFLNEFLFVYFSLLARLEDKDLFFGLPLLLSLYDSYVLRLYLFSTSENLHRKMRLTNIVQMVQMIKNLPNKII